jgi:hypothetical protein
MKARTEVATIIGILGFGTEGPKASRPCRGRCLDLSVVRVEMAGPFPVLQVVWDAIPAGHGRIKMRRVLLMGRKPWGEATMPGP